MLHPIRFSVPIFLAFLTLCLSCTNSKTTEKARPEEMKVENGTVTGVVTFEQERGSSARSDVGSQIYALYTDSLGMGYNLLTLDTFYQVAQTWNLKVTGGGELEGNLAKRLETYDMVEKEKFEDLQTRTVGAFVALATQSSIPKTTVDGDGKYLLSLSPGEYKIVIKSKNQKRNNMPEIDGQIVIKSVTVKSAGTEEVSNNFRPDLY